MKTNRKYKYDIAISFAEEERDIAGFLDAVFRSSLFKKINAFYYPKFKSTLIGEDLEKILPRIYEKEARYALIILSDRYLHKNYCQIELAAIQRRRNVQEERYAFVIQKGDTEPEAIGFPKGFVYHQWRHDAEQLTEILKQILHKPWWQKPAYRILFVLFSLSVILTSGYFLSYQEKPSEPEPVTHVQPSIPLYTKAFTKREKPNLALLVVDANYQAQTALSGEIVRVLQKRGVEAYVGLLNPEVVNAHVIDELLMQNSISLEDYEPEKKLDYIAVGLLRYSVSKDDLGSVVVGASLDLSILALTDSTTNSNEVLRFQGSGTHDSKASAQSIAIQSLIGKMNYSLGYRFKPS
jgi:hypothetical protein